MKHVIKILFILSLGSSAYADQVCGNRVHLLINNNLCGDTVPSYSPPSGCTVASSSITGCIAVYNVCCPVEGTARYTDSGAQVTVLPNVSVGNEYDAAASYYETAKDGLNAPSCQAPYIYNSEMKGYVYDVKPSQSDYTKSDVRITMWNRVGCEKFTNTTAIPIEPIGGGSGGSGGGSTVNVDLTTTNNILTQIKAVLDSHTGENLPVLNDIKNLLQNGVGGSTDMTETNTLLQTVINKLSPASCYVDPKSGQNVCTYGPMVVNDPASVELLTQIKDILQNGGGGSTDMTATNGLLSGITDLLTTVKDSVLSGVEALTSLVSSVSGDSSLQGYSDNTASKTPFSSSFFEAGTPTLDSYKTAFNGFTNDMKATALFSLVGGFFGGAPTGGSSVVSFDGGVYGSHSYDFSSWGSVLSVLKGIILVVFAAASMRIIFLKGGG